VLIGTFSCQPTASEASISEPNPKVSPTNSNQTSLDHKKERSGHPQLPSYFYYETIPNVEWLLLWDIVGKNTFVSMANSKPNLQHLVFDYGFSDIDVIYISAIDFDGSNHLCYVSIYICIYIDIDIYIYVYIYNLSIYLLGCITYVFNNRSFSKSWIHIVSRLLVQRLAADLHLATTAVVQSDIKYLIL
jgi:hypothetical protein